ncbi:YbaB/EbfC family nucleoid-associated protein [Mollicutes bacterium LVI A0039]|nr:YbaB/EbfC family nucleoid-associated protein [Mollicutes bacterium LVI A0039]
MNQKQIQQMMKQAQKMQNDVKSLQEELAATEYTETVGGGAVEIVMNGSKTVKSISIKEEVIDPEDKEMLEELVMLAVNNVIAKIDAEADSKVGAITGGLPF